MVKKFAFLCNICIINLMLIILLSIFISCFAYCLLLSIALAMFYFAVFFKIRSLCYANALYHITLAINFSCGFFLFF